MTIKELKKLIRKLPDTMEVVIEVGADRWRSVCGCSDVVNILDEETDEVLDQVLLVVPCDCSENDEDENLAPVISIEPLNLN